MADSPSSTPNDNFYEVASFLVILLTITYSSVSIKPRMRAGRLKTKFPEGEGDFSFPNRPDPSGVRSTFSPIGAGLKRLGCEAEL